MEKEVNITLLSLIVLLVFETLLMGLSRTSKNLLMAESVQRRIMTQIDINPILLLVATALVSGFYVVESVFYEAWKEQKESTEKIINEELQSEVKE
jgi:flagellar biosynthesis protein FliP